MSDDHSANAVSCYGSLLASVFRTPNIDRIAREGTRLNHFYCTNAICTPARATLMTGQYSHVNGVRTLIDSWDGRQGPNLAKILQQEGYTTAMFGKWHLHSAPWGFDACKFLSAAGGQGTYQNPEFMEMKSDGSFSLHQHPGYVTDIITEMCVSWLREEREREKPFFLMCHHKAPHDFWEYAPRHEDLFQGKDIPVPDSLFENKSHRSAATREYGSSVTPRSKVRSLYAHFCKPSYVTGPLTGTENMTFEEKGHAAYQKYLKDYLRTVAAIDESVGTLLDELEMQGILDETLIIYTSDQGMFLGEHDYQDKRWSFEESLRSPFAVRYPPAIPAGGIGDLLMANVDLAPTLLDYAGVQIPKEMQGISCRKIFECSAESPVRQEVYYRYWMHLANGHNNPSHFGIRTDRWKLTFYYGLPLDAQGAIQQESPAGWELYDMGNDPMELKNLYGLKEYAEIVSNLKQRLDQVRQEVGDTDEKYPDIGQRMNMDVIHEGDVLH
ncbi:MAG TPA: acetylglucosamine-6-sulfatase [Clostridiales bacterium]|nr:acetylglucosamine-6-sulfatase [Clostridiales bacterium]